MKSLIPFLGAISLAACASAPVQQPPLTQPVQMPVIPAASAGAIYRNGHGMALFEDRRARQVGDMITVLLVEQTRAQKSASTSTKKDTSTTLPAPTLFGAPITSGGRGIVDTDIATQNSFGGTGDTSQSNKLEGQLTVMVTEVFANGALRIAGEKQLLLNQGVERLRVTGLIRPEDIGPNNIVPSSRIAMADISYSGSGPVADATAMGWLARFFQSPLWPF